MYKRILLPTDGTELCERAIRHGIALAKFAQAKVVGVTAILTVSLWIIPARFFGMKLRGTAL
jgi:nucleotide-binding universal stress UspA family protein